MDISNTATELSLMKGFEREITKHPFLLECFERMWYSIPNHEYF
jgi:hypothetical protein